MWVSALQVTSILGSSVAVGGPSRRGLPGDVNPGLLRRWGGTLPERLTCYGVQPHTARCTTCQSTERQGFGVKNSHFLCNSSGPRRRWTSGPKEPCFPVINRIQAAFLPKWQGVSLVVARPWCLYPWFSRSCPQVRAQRSYKSPTTQLLFFCSATF